MFNVYQLPLMHGTLFFPVHRKILLMVDIKYHGFYQFIILEIYNK
jgi:hypothetical protein